jgi:hypothetical protein
MWLAISHKTGLISVMKHEGDYEEGDTLVRVEAEDRIRGVGGVTIEVRPTLDV